MTVNHAITRTLRTVDRLLERVYGPRAHTPGWDPLDALIWTILSQNTSDVNSDRAHDALHAAFPDWQSVLRAPVRDLERVLRPGGLAKTKARRIQRILSLIAQEHGHLDLDWLRDRPSAEAEQWLLGFDGVGYKTARCVLLFSLGRDVFPIDTHIFRILGRLGVIPPGMTAEKAHRFVQPLVPEGRCLSLHINLIAHGRGTCHARNPECGRCPIRRHCAWNEAGR